MQRLFTTAIFTATLALSGASLFACCSKSSKSASDATTATTTTTATAPAVVADQEPAPALPVPATEPVVSGTAPSQMCGDKTCEPGQTCVSYYGIAGSKGPKFQSCERVCKTDSDCFKDAPTCKTIADGPGSVCRK